MSELAEAKKQAEIEADEAWSNLVASMGYYRSGGEPRNDMLEYWEAFKASHNTERGLRHES